MSVKLHAIVLLVVFAVVGVLAADLAVAQEDARPSNDRREVPPYDVAEDSILDARDGGSTPIPRGVPRLVVERFVFQGNTAFPDEALASLLADRVGRPLETEDLVAARDAITAHYVEAGYETSGALLPDQDVSDGVVVFAIVEGALSAVEVAGTRRFSPDYFEMRLLEAGRAPLDVARLETALHVFQQDPLIERVIARIEPTSTIGRSRLRLEIQEARAEDLRLVVHNDRSPAVGAETGAFRFQSSNWLGRRDTFSAAGWFTEGLRDVEARWSTPIDRFDTRVAVRVRYSDSELVEPIFSALDIESESLLVSLGVAHPVYRTRQHLIELGLQGDWRRGQSTLDGSLFCFQPEVVDCTPTVTTLRARADWLWRGRDHALALRTGVSWGMKALGATTRPGQAPDGRFVAWLTQGQFAYRLARGSQLISRFDFQLTEDALLAFERISVGGARTVRGYRPNQLVRDSGLDASIEWREPLWARVSGPAYLSIAPFFDVGHAWNERNDDGDNTIASLGLGLIARPHDRVEASLYWGARLLGVDRVGEGAIGEGLHFRVVVDAW